MLIDSATIEVRSGKGGDGCVSFRREKYVPKGGPDGGDGGRGGSVTLVASGEVETLLDFAGRHHWHAENGQPGGPKSRHGRDGADLEVPVPPGTLVYDAESGELLVDLDAPGRRHLAAEGGKGGLGNEHFKSPTHQVPREATPGGPAQQRQLRLELKLIADVGLIGKPNAGKSTLLAAVSRARPRIADYPFTTLEPQLGIAELPEHRRLVIADIPGLIERAHTGRGLGMRFLRHIERTRVLVHVLELEPVDGSDPVDNYHAVRRELAAYSATLAAKPELVALSKMDLLGGADDRAAAVSMLERALERRVLAFSGATQAGVPALLEACWNAASEQPAQQERQSQEHPAPSPEAPGSRPAGDEPARKGDPW